MGKIHVHKLRERANKMVKEYPTVRRGQALMNVLHEMHPKVYYEISGTDADIFYVRDDEPMNHRVKHFWEAIHAAEV